MKKVTILFVCFIMMIILGFFFVYGDTNEFQTLCKQNRIEIVDFYELTRTSTNDLSKRLEQIKTNFMKITTKENQEQTTTFHSLQSSQSGANPIRVLLKSSNYQTAYHKYLACKCQGKILVVTKNGVTIENANQEVIIHPSDLDDEGLKIVPQNKETIQIANIHRKDEVRYDGILECFKSKSDITVINQLSVENYIQGVIPSEMPSSYPMEALKAQAVVARSYAYFHMQSYAYPEVKAHVDDSTSFQVYGNINGTENTKQAVLETENEILEKNKEIQECMYYSTSAGECPKAEKAFQKRIKNGSKKDMEYEEGWYRWSCSYQLSWDTLKSRILNCSQVSEQEKSICKKATKWKNLMVNGREENGQIADLCIVTNAGNIHMIDQYTIRTLLAVDGTVVEKKDGTQFIVHTILPSPFFYFSQVEIKKNQGTLVLSGGGFGHGIGMSQNGAKQMALQQKTYEEIINLYYGDQISAYKN